MMNDISNKVYRLLAVVLLLAGATALAVAVTMSASYVKSLGQTNAEGKFPFLTSGGRMAVDEEGNVYAGSPHGYNPLINKISPDGKILWQIYVFGCGLQSTAVDDKYLYTCGAGYYGHSFLQRRLRDTGQPAPGWQYDWDRGKKENNKPPADKVNAMTGPGALLLDDKFIYVADTAGNEIRRFEKESGNEAPFTPRLMVVKPLDMAFSQAGAILILTEEAVIEVDKTGKSLRIPVIAGLRSPAALDVSRKTGAIYIAEAGDNLELINRVRMYTPEGKSLNMEIGIGGDFNGKWYPLSFAFSSGGGDIALDPKGGLWVNGNGQRMDYCSILTHLTPGPQFKPDLTLRGVTGTGLIVDPNLDVYVGGSYKISWDDKLKWTSGLVDPGPANLFPTTLGGWMMNPVWSDGKTAIIAAVHHNFFYQVNAKNGAALGKTLPGGGSGISGSCTVGRDIFFTVFGGRTIQRTTVDLDAPQLFLTMPEGMTLYQGAIAVSPDQQWAYVPCLIDSGKPTQYVGIACCRKDGTELWKVKGNLLALCRGVLFTNNPDGYGIAALDAVTGKRIALFGEKEENGRPPISGIGSLTIGSKDGADYLFIHSNARILVYRVTIG